MLAQTVPSPRRRCPPLPSNFGCAPIARGPHPKRDDSSPANCFLKPRRNSALFACTSPLPTPLPLPLLSRFWSQYFRLEVIFESQSRSQGYKTLGSCFAITSYAHIRRETARNSSLPHRVDGSLAHHGPWCIPVCTLRCSFDRWLCLAGLM